MFQGSIKLFTVRGIEVRLDYSWFIIFILVTWSLAGEYFPTHNPNWSPFLYWSLGLVTSILFFVSVLLHELAHSFVAQSHGTRVPRITLFIFGGAAQIAEEPKNARDEFTMALAGPAMSVVICAASGAAWAMTRDAAPALGALFGWLSMINLSLAIFNLVPGFPLDGGRVLRAMIWGATHDMDKATRIAAAVGRGVALLFIVMGVYVAFVGSVVSGIWTAFIGWFLLNAATQTSRRQVFQRLLQGHVAGEVMWRDCPFIDARTPVSELVYQNILNTGRRCFPVMEGERVAGIVTIHNIKSTPPEQWANTATGQIMIRAESLKTVAPETPLSKVMEMMAGDGVNQVPVVQEGRFLGMVTREGLMDFLKTKSELGLG